MNNRPEINNLEDCIVRFKPELAKSIENVLGNLSDGKLIYPKNVIDSSKDLPIEVYVFEENTLTIVEVNGSEYVYKTFSLKGANVIFIDHEIRGYFKICVRNNDYEIEMDTFGEDRLFEWTSYKIKEIYKHLRKSI